MKNTKIVIMLTLFIALASCATSLDNFQAYHDFQNDADIIRLEHLRYYGVLIEEFYATTGTYPFMDEAEIPVYVHVALPKQLDSITQKPPYAHKERSFAKFVSLIESKLGRSINEYYDPQYGADYKPNFYIFMVVQDTYFFAIHQHNIYPFSKPVSKYYNKIEISNNPTPANRSMSPKVLFSDSEFNAHLNKHIVKEDFFRERERKHLHQTKG